MHLLRVIPLNRKIPGGELSYISKTNFNIGEVIWVPLKKKTELAIVTNSNPVSSEKEYIKSLSYKLITISETDFEFKIHKKVFKTLIDFSLYSMTPLDSIVRVFLGKIKTNKKNNLESEIILATKETKDKNEISLHNFFKVFMAEKSKLKKLIIKDPEKFTVYGQNYLGFDPLAFFVLLSNNLGFELYFKTNYQRLAYKKWPIKYLPVGSTNNGTIDILTRNSEVKEEKKNVFIKEIKKVILDGLQKNKRILILGSGKNFSTRTICGDCSHIHSCTNCKSPLVLVKNNRNYAKKFEIPGEYIYVCTNCRNAENSIAKCRNCESWNLVPLGYGIERIYENLLEIIDKNQHKRISDMTQSLSIKKLASWQNDGGIIIGNLNFIYNDIYCETLIVPSLSAVLYNEAYDSSEKAREIIKFANNNSENTRITVMQAEESELLRQKEESWLMEESKDRKLLHYPPYARFVSISLDPYASKSETLKNAIFNIIQTLAIKDSVNLKTTTAGIINISASFKLEYWDVVDSNFKTPVELLDRLLPFLKHIKIKVD